MFFVCCLFNNFDKQKIVYRKILFAFVLMKLNKLNTYLLLEERSVVASLDLLRDVVASLSSLFLVSTAAWYSRHGTKFTPVVPGAGHMHF